MMELLQSHDVSKAIDAALGTERAVTGETRTNIGMQGGNFSAGSQIGTVQRRDEAATPEAQQWQGWGTALKPAWEPIVVARKPLDGTVAANVLAHGTGGINVDGCRVTTNEPLGRTLSSRSSASSVNAYNWSTRPNPLAGEFLDNTHGLGRWPANLIHDGSDEVVGLFGDAARFFYCSKASKRDREEGLDDAELRELHRVNSGGLEHDPRWAPIKRANHHPTVKPTDLMRYLCRLVTPRGGIVLDPFMGSGSTGKASVLEGFSFVGIEREPEYHAIAEARIRHVMPEPPAPPEVSAPPGQLSLW